MSAPLRFLTPGWSCPNCNSVRIEETDGLNCCVECGQSWPAIPLKGGQDGARNLGFFLCALVVLFAALFFWPN